jgi:hypothetical protein
MFGDFAARFAASALNCNVFGYLGFNVFGYFGFGHGGGVLEVTPCAIGGSSIFLLIAGLACKW